MLIRGFLLLLSLLALSIENASAEPLNTLREDALFRVVAEKPNGNALGTAFLDEDGLLITAYHVIEGARTIELYSFDGSVFDNVVVDFIAPSRDMATLTVDGLSGRSGYTINTDVEAIRAGNMIALHGAPLGFEGVVLRGHLVKNGLQVGTVWLAPDGKGSESSIFQDPQIQVLPLDITTEGGASGAPVVDTNGNVIGILSGSRNTGGGIAWAIPINALKDERAGWRQVSSLPANVAWPTESVLRAGVSFGRSLAVTAPNSPSVRCLTATQVLEDSRQNYNVHVLRMVDFAKKFYETVTRNGTISREEVPDDRIHYTRRIFNEIASGDVSVMVQQVASDLERDRAKLHSTCFPSRMNDEANGPFATTKNNVLIHQRLNRSIEEFFQNVDEIEERNDLVHILQPFLETMTDENLSDDQKFLRAVEMVVEMESDISAELEASASEVKLGYRASEYHAALEVGMDTQTAVYDIFAGSLTISGRDGWLPAESEIAEVLLPGTGLQDVLVGLYADALPHSPGGLATLWSYDGRLASWDGMNPPVEEHAYDIVGSHMKSRGFEVAEVLGSGPHPTSEDFSYLRIRGGSTTQPTVELLFTIVLPTGPWPPSALICESFPTLPIDPCFSFDVRTTG